MYVRIYKPLVLLMKISVLMYVFQPLIAFETFTALIRVFSLRALSIANFYVIFEEHLYNRLIHASILGYRTVAVVPK